MILNKNFFKNFVIFAIVISLLSSIIPFSVFAQDNSGIVADWNFNEEDSTGSISNGNLVIKDKSNNGNDLRMNLYSASVPTDDKSAEDWDKYLKFSDFQRTGQKVTSGWESWQDKLIIQKMLNPWTSQSLVQCPLLFQTARSFNF